MRLEPEVGEDVTHTIQTWRDGAREEKQRLVCVAAMLFSR